MKSLVSLNKKLLFSPFITSNLLHIRKPHQWQHITFTFKGKTLLKDV